MSSHHIVKEDQEPALIIDDLDGISPDQLGQLLEWSPTVLAHSDNFKLVVERGIKIDVLFANEPIDLPQDHVTILPLSDIFLDGALSYLVSSGYQAANVVSNVVDPKRLLQYTNTINTTLLGNGRRIFTVKSGFSKWKPQGEAVYVYGDSLVVDTVGLTRQGTDHYLTESDGFYAVHFAQEYGLVGELL